MIENFELIKNGIKVLLEEKKSYEIVDIDISGCDYRLSDSCIIASGTSARQMNATGEYVYKFFKHFHLTPIFEGRANSGWIMIEAGGIEVHLFRPEMRVYYDLESLIK